MHDDHETNRPTQPWLHRTCIMVGGFAIAIYALRTFNWWAAASAFAFAIGVGLNVAVMLANRGRMPVDTGETVVDEDNHQSMTRNTRLRWLGDWISCGPWMISPGDVVLYAGLVLLVLNRWLRQN